MMTSQGAIACASACLLAASCYGSLEPPGVTGVPDGSDGPDSPPDVLADPLDVPDTVPDTLADALDARDGADLEWDAPPDECGNGLLDPGEECDDGNEVMWDGCGECAIVEIQVNTSTSGDQMHPSAALTDAGFVVVWEGETDEGFDIFGQRFDAAGGLAGPEFGINVHTADDQMNPSVDMAPDGSFVVAWQSYGQDGEGWGIFARMFGPDGAPLGAELQVNENGEDDQTKPQLSVDRLGGFVVAWESHDGSDQGVFARLFDPSGLPLDGTFRVNDHRTHSQAECSVAMASDGKFVVAWESYMEDGSLGGIYAKLYTEIGSVSRHDFLVNTYITQSQSTPSVDMADDGTIVVVWKSDGQDGDGWGIFGQQLDESGGKVGEEVRLNTGTSSNQTHPAVAVQTGGRSVVAWSSLLHDGSGYGVFGQRLSHTGSFSGTEFRSNTFTLDDQWVSAVAMGPDGRFLVAWSSYEMDGSGAGVFAQRYDASGNALGSLAW